MSVSKRNLTSRLVIGAFCSVLVFSLIFGSSNCVRGKEMSQSEIDQLMVQFLSPNFGASLQAQNALVELGDPAIPALKDVFFKNRDPWNRVKVVNVLGRIGSHQAVELLVTGIEDSDEIVRSSTVSAIEKLDAEVKAIAAQCLMPYLIHNQLTVRSTVVDLLVRIDVDKADMALGLMEVVHKSQGQQRELALTELTKLGSAAKNVVKQLLALTDFDNQAKLDDSLRLLKVITAIGDTEDRQVYQILSKMLLSSDFALRQEAILGMRWLGLSQTEMVAPVKTLFASGSIAEQEFAVKILIQLAITQPQAVEELMELVSAEYLPNEVRESVIKGLESLVPKLEYHLDRGLTAVMTDNGVFLSWRLLGTEQADVGFNVYRSGTKLNTVPITTSTNYLDREGTLALEYFVTAVYKGVEEEPPQAVVPWEQNYLSIPLARPADGITPAGERYKYAANDGSAGDLTGDGQYEIILKWDPSNAKDNAHDGYTGNVYFDAYTMDGDMLWRIDLGCNIRAGAHYTQFIVYDLDGDGKAEIVMKTADGTVDGLGNVIGDPNADYRTSNGRILSGPEYLTVFDGETGAALTTIDYKPPRGNVNSWGDGYGNRVDRFLAGVAYLDGVTPSVIMCRGYYTRTVLVAYNFEDGELHEVWTFDSNESGLYNWGGQGNHQLSVADVDADGRDEIIYGAITIDHDGTGLYNTRLGHGDALHVADHDPARPGLEVFAVHESTPHTTGINLRDARTGEILWGIPTNYDVGRGVAANIDPNYRGSETWAGRSSLMDVNGKAISSTVPSMNFAIWWDGDLQRELLDGTTISKWDWENQRLVTLLSPREVASNNGSKATPTLQADILGDWREEVIWRTHDSSELRIYTTTELTNHRLYTLVHDRMYRTAIAWQNVAYNQPPHPSFYIGEDMEPQTYNPGLIKSFLERLP